MSTNQRSKLGHVHSPKHSLNLMQNCDLPPSVKLFSRPDWMFMSSISKINKTGECLEVEDEQLYMYKDCLKDDKLEILKALRLSQTRAREAERKLWIVSKEKEVLSNMLVDESLRVFAHRQWVNVLEFEVLKLQRDQPTDGFVEESVEREDHDEGSSSNKWWASLAVCLAIAGVGFVFGCGYLF